MGLGTLRERQLVRNSGHIFRLDTLLPTGQWCMTELSTGLVDQKTDIELWAAYESGDLVFLAGEADAQGRALRELVQEFSEAAIIGPSAPVQQDSDGSIGAKRANYVLAVRGKTKNEAIQSILTLWASLEWPNKPPGYSTVMRWHAKANGYPNPACALRAGHKKKGRRSPWYVKDVLDVMRGVRDSRFMAMNPRISIAKAVEIVGDKIRLINAARPKSEQFEIPGRKAFVAILKEIDAAEVLAARYGADKALAMLRISLGGVKVTRPLERVEIDHTVLSIILLDDNFEPIGRAFITAAKDAFTRSVVGYYWGAENPSVVSLARCLKHAIQPKIGFLTRYENVESEWPCFGAAESWVIDNGMEEHADALRQAGAECGVQKVEFCRRASPWQKPNIERFFRTQDQSLLHGLPGTTMENIAKRTDFDPKKDVLIRWSTFGRILAKWVVDIYMQAPQKILKNRSPSKAWNDSKNLFTPYVPEQSTILDCLFLRQVNGRLLDHEGIEFDCLVYNSLDMGLLRSKFGPRLKVNVRANDEEISFIYVQVPGRDIWVRVPALDQEYAEGMTRWQHKKCKQMKKVCAEEGVDLSLAQAREQIRDDVDAEARAVTQGRKKARERMKEKPATSGGFSEVTVERGSPVGPAATEEDIPAAESGSIPELESDVFERS